MHRRFEMGMQQPRQTDTLQTPHITGTADYLFPTEIANGAGNSLHKPFVVMKS